MIQKYRNELSGLWTDKLVHLGACEDAVEWAMQFGSPEAAWEACTRADRLMWFAGRCAEIGAESHRRVVAACVESGRLLLPFFEARFPEDGRVRECFETTERAARGTATIADVKRAQQGADAAAERAQDAYTAMVFMRSRVGDESRGVKDASYAAVLAALCAEAAASAACAEDAADLAVDASSVAGDARVYGDGGLLELIARAHFPEMPTIPGLEGDRQ